MKVDQWAKPKPMIPAKARPINLVSHSPLSASENLPQDLRYPVNPVNVDEGQVSQTSTRKLVRTNQSPEVESSQVRRQENTQRSDSRNPGRQGGIFELDQYKEICTGSDSKDRVSELDVHKPTIHDEGLPFFCKKKLGITARYSTFALEASKTNVLMWEMFISSSTKAAIHLGPNCLANLEIYKNTNFEESSEFIQCHTEIDIGAF